MRPPGDFDQSRYVVIISVNESYLVLCWYIIATHGVVSGDIYSSHESGRSEICDERQKTTDSLEKLSIVNGP